MREVGPIPDRFWITLSHGENDDGIPNIFFTKVVRLSSLPGAILAGVIVDEQRVTLDTGSMHPEFGAPVREFREKSGKERLWSIVSMLVGLIKANSDYRLHEGSSE